MINGLNQEESAGIWEILVTIDGLMRGPMKEGSQVFGEANDMHPGPVHSPYGEPRHMEKKRKSNSSERRGEVPDIWISRGVQDEQKSLTRRERELSGIENAEEWVSHQGSFCLGCVVCNGLMEERAGGEGVG